MRQYLLSIWQPDGETPPREVLEAVMRDVNALIAETKKAGVWVFNGGLYPAATATVSASRTATCSSLMGRTRSRRSTSAAS